jgi:hypothetical protein
MSLGKEVSIPIEEVSSDEAGNKVVCANGTTGSYEEKSDGDREEQVRFLINPIPACKVRNNSLQDGFVDLPSKGKLDGAA